MVLYRFPSRFGPKYFHNQHNLYLLISSILIINNFNFTLFLKSTGELPLPRLFGNQILKLPHDASQGFTYLKSGAPEPSVRFFKLNFIKRILQIKFLKINFFTRIKIHDRIKITFNSRRYPSRGRC